MALLIRISTRDTWAEMELAARRRYVDGLLLATSETERFLAAIYLLGYVAEIMVKTAYYRFRGVGPLDDVAPELAGMPARARVLGFPWRGNRHNLESLAGLLIAERAALRRAMPPALAAEFQAHATNVSAHWSEQLRYKDPVVLASELNDMLSSVDWLLVNHAHLWS